MKSPYLTKHHHELRKQVRDFAEREIRPVATELDEKAEFSVELSRKMGQLGLLGLAIPEDYGGQGRDYLSLIIAVEEICRIDGSQGSTVAAHNSLGIGPIYNYGTEKQKRELLPKLTSGNYVWAFGLTEKNAGSDSRGTETTAELKDGYWHINGEKLFISNSTSEMSAGVSLQCITEENENGRKEYSTILVESGTKGFTTERIRDKMMWRAGDTGKLICKDVKVPESNLLGKRGAGSRMMLETLDSGRLSVAAMGLGHAQGAFDAALKYSKERKQFGKPIGRFQAVSFKLAEMATKIEASRNMLYHATWLKMNDYPFAKEAAMAKLYCTETAKEVADEAVQIFGAYALVKGNEVERHYRDQRILQIGEGTSEIIKLVISRSL
ncbi:MAG: acyl-CoA dehydrogenase family protein [Bacteroidales bacterium]|nr:acyl-CoA dehydrogenase family protein [Bacteroidales bacterium]